MAGASVGSAYLEIIPSARGFTKNLQSELGSGLDRAGRDAGDRTAKGFGSKFKSGLKSALTGVGGMVAGAFAAAGVANLFADSIAGASELQQSVGGVEAVFGKYADGVKKDSKAAAQSLGLSQNAYNELITVSGAMLKNKGLKNFADESKNLITVGADLAAQFGGSTQEAVDALNAAMRGESDPIERYGISLNETAVNAYLASKGLDNLKGPALEQAKTQARLALIQQQSADATGAFGRESETLAGKQARLTASWENAKATLGQALLPLLTRLADWANEKVVPAIAKFAEEMQNGTGQGGEFVDKVKEIVEKAKDFGKWIGENADKIKVLAAGVGTAVVAFKGLMFINNVTTAVKGLNLALRMNPIGLVVTAIGLLVAGLIYAYQNSETFRDVVDAAFKAVGAVAKWLWNNVFQPVIRFILEGFAKLTDGVGDFLISLSNIPGFGWARDAGLKMKDAAGKAQLLADNINKIPDEVKVNIAVIAKASSTALKALNLASSGSSRKAQALVGMENRAHGGPVAAGQPVVVGDNPDGSWNKTTEVWWPDSAGTILNQRQLAGMGGGRIHPHDIQALAEAIANIRPVAVIDSAHANHALLGGM